MAKFINGQKIVDAVFEGGLVGNPSIRFVNSLKDGFYYIGANNIGLSLDGTKSWDFGTASTTTATPISFTTGVAMTAGNYQIGRNADGTNLMQLNVPTGSGFEFSVNDVQVVGIGSLGSIYSASGIFGLDATDYIQFTNNTSQAFYVNGTLGFAVKSSSIEANTINSLNTTVPMSFKNYETDAADSIAFVYDTDTAFTAAGAKLAQWKNATVEKAYIDKDGGFYSANGIYGHLTDINTYLYFPGDDTIYFYTNGSSRAVIGSSGIASTFRAASADSSINLKGRENDDANAIGAKIGNETTLTTAGAKIASFYNDNLTTEKAYIDYHGNFYAPANKALIIGVEDQSDLANTAGVGLSILADDGGGLAAGVADGGGVTITAGDAGGSTGNGNGGIVQLTGGAKVNSGTSGYVRIGNGTPTNLISIFNTESLYVDGYFEVNNASRFNSTSTFGSGLIQVQNQDSIWSSGNNATAIRVSTASTPNSWMFGVSANSRTMMLVEKADITTDFGLGIQANPTLAIQSSDDTKTYEGALYTYSGITMRTIGAVAAGGTTYTIQGQDAGTSGDQNGGDISLTAGIANGAGVPGQIKLNSDILITLGALQSMAIDGFATAHAPDSNILGLTGTWGNVDTGTVAGIVSSVTSGGMTTTGNSIAAYSASIAEAAGDQPQTAMIAYQAAPPSGVAGSATLIAFGVISGYDKTLATIGSAMVISSVTAGAGNGHDVSIYASEAQGAGPNNGGIVKIYGGAKAGAGNDGYTIIGQSATTSAVTPEDDDLFVIGNVEVGARLLGKQGSDVASANDITLGDGNYFDITGTTETQRILGTGWTVGSVIIFQFDASVTVKHNTAASDGYYGFQLAGAGDFAATAGDTLMVIFDGAWFREVSRTAI